ncbi:bacterioferritin-associated ferredoxin [Streptomyces sp. NPDC052042]|uniref:bacterioferritin-associated ferredoxin n=1 Tax=Streptomyces sp. NPDC052042 TaxID=3365683 RepID=UPI0037D26BD6
MYVCSCFGVTEQQVKEHAEAGARTPRKIASVCKAGTDCGGCVRAIQAVLGRGSCPRRELLDRKRTSGAEPDATGSDADALAPADARRAVPPARLHEAA